MNDSLKTGYIAVFAVSGSVVFLAMHAYKRLISDFIKKMEFEIKSSRGAIENKPKKKARFTDDVITKSAIKKAYVKKHPPRLASAAGGRKYGDQSLEAMPENRRALYRGILEYRNLRGYYNF